jgi:hypothetical protein
VTTNLEGTVCLIHSLLTCKFTLVKQGSTSVAIDVQHLGCMF